jgi:hypothetical protein
MNHRQVKALVWGGSLALGLGVPDRSASAQLDLPDCPSSYTLPAPVTARAGNPPSADSDGPADPDEAVGASRIVCLTNSGINIRCKSGAPRSGGAGETMPLYGLNAGLDNVMFQQDPDLQHGQLADMGDTRVIYDGYEDRFWIISAEHGEMFIDEMGTTRAAGRLHFAVSKSGGPDNGTTGSWYKYTYGGNAGLALDPENIQCAQGVNCASFDPSAIPDVPNIVVDQTYLYLAVREGITEPVDPTDDRTLVVIFNKDKFLTGNPGDPPVVEKSMFIDDITAHPWGHALAVDNDINGSGRVYLVSLPSYPSNGKTYTSIRFGMLRKTTNNPNSWTYSAKNLPLPTSPTDYRIRGVSTSAPGGDGDTNSLRYSLFRHAETRLMGGTDRKVWGAHHVRPYSPGNDEVARIQLYRIDPDVAHVPPNWNPSIEVIKRLNLSPAWAHDPGLGVNSCGDSVVYFTKSVGDSGYPEMWERSIPATGQESTNLVQTGPDQYYDSQGQPWADFAAGGVDPADDSRFLGHSIVVRGDGTQNPSTDKWQSILAETSLHSCGERQGPDKNPDLNNDGSADLLDLLLFQDLYRRGNAVADWDGDGPIDGFDFLRFLQGVQEAGR